MSFQKKVMVLCDIQSGVATGTIKFVSDGDASTAAIKLHNSADVNYGVLLKIDGRLLKYDAAVDDVLSLKQTVFDTVDCLVTKADKPYLFGSTSADKYRCFNLLDEYKKLQNNTEKPEIRKLDNEEKAAEIPPENIVEEQEITDDNDEEQPMVLDEYSGFEIKTGTIDKKEILSAGVDYDGTNFYVAVKPQLDEMFICYPADEELNGLVPNSQWVRVETADDYYVVGIINELDEPKFICYGIHGEYAVKPPDDIKDVCDWLPLSLSAPEGAGYWIIYQSAENGKTIRKT